jgi:hypothetical protein
MLLLMWPSRLVKIERPGRLFWVGLLLAHLVYLHKINPYVILLPNWRFEFMFDLYSLEAV